MKTTAYILALFSIIAMGRAQIVTVDTLFVQGQAHHAAGVRFRAQGKLAKALEEFNIATDKLRDVQDGLSPQGDSLIHLSEKLLTSNPQSPVYNYLFGRALQRPKPDGPDSIRSLFYL